MVGCNSSSGNGSGGGNNSNNNVVIVIIDRTNWICFIVVFYQWHMIQSYVIQ